ncbi:MAG: PglZ domain-containing protein [Microbacteriaceae bacterium]|nr:PglZ domain-containing protein [Microbacteriaceae bacterium]
MLTMLPSAPKSLGRLGEVLISALKSASGETNTLGLPSRRSVCVILVDGLGSTNLKSAAGHARFLNSQQSDSAMCWFPATTSTSITSFATAQVFNRSTQTPMNLLSGWKDYSEGENYQEASTIAELASSRGVGFHTVAPSAYERSGFTGATMRGSDFHGVDKISDRLNETQKLLAQPEAKVIYLYIPELDQLAHAKGVESTAWLNQLEDLDSLVRDFMSSIPKGSGVILTADHGVVDVPKENHVYLDELMAKSDFKFVGGDTRSLYLYFEDAVDKQAARELLEDRLGDSCYICTPEDLIAGGYWNTLSAKSENVAPDLLVLARKRVALYHRGFAKVKSLEMVGHHGSITNEELAIPLLKFCF